MVFRILRACCRLFFLPPALFLSLVLLSLSPLKPGSPARNGQRQVRLTARLARLVTRTVLRIPLTVSGSDRLGTPCLIVANHSSYLDIPLLLSVVPCRFITSHDIGRYPLPAALARGAGTIIVDRGNRGGLHREIEAIAAALARGEVVTLFPEATTSDGTRVLPFHPALFEGAIQAGAPVHPVCIRYRRRDGSPLSPAELDRVAWYGDMTFIPHLFAFLILADISVQVEVCPPLPTGPRKQLAHHGWNTINTLFTAP